MRDRVIIYDKTWDPATDGAIAANTSQDLATRATLERDYALIKNLVKM
ncbi:MAG: hypothetical protein ACTSXC_07490 [Candidatus Freyarchaeota archaeon]